ncbi:MAG: glycosyltransferase family 39 protein, partial [Patescibacteria group bacterium]
MSLKKFIKHKVGIILVLIISLSFVLNVIKQGTPPCVNADEAAFAYNAYSLLKTGSDEYGAPFPVRLKSFGDYKMPLYSYGSIPFIFLFGLNELGARAFNTLLITLLPLAIFFLTKELFNKKSVSLLAAFLTGSSLALHIVGRQAHEALLSVFAITLTSLFFVKYIKTGKYRFGLLFSILLFISLFTYQSARIFGVTFFILSLFYFAKKKFHRNILFTVILALFIFLLTDLRFKPTRIENLLFFRT